MRHFGLPAILVVLVVGLVGFLGAPEGCLACTCARLSPAEGRERTPVIFAGRVSRVEMQRRADGSAYQRATFVVSTIWKGTVTREATVYGGSGGGDCGYFFEVGEDYLVYANPSGGSGPSATPLGGYEATKCGRTAPLAYAAADLAALGPGTPPAGAPLPTLPNTGEGYPPTLASSATPSLIALLFLSAVFLGVGTIGRRKGRPE